MIVEHLSNPDAVAHAGGDAGRPGAALARDIRAAGRLHEELAGHLVACAGPAERVRGSGGVPGIPLNTRAVDARRDLLAVLSSWSALVVEELGVAAPERSAPALAGFLAGHADWLAGHDAGPDAAEEFRDLVRRADRVVHGSAGKQVPLGSCPRPTCTGALVARLGPADSDRESVIVCLARDDHRWTPRQWHALAFTATEPARPARRPLGVTEIAAAWRVPPGTVYWLAKTHGWRRHRDGRKVFYEREDVLRTMATREGAA